MYGKRILITGITGFIGQHLVEFLRRYYPCVNIIGIGRNATRRSLDCNFYSVDLLNKEAVESVVNETKPDYIFHLAGLVFSYDWNELYQGNVVSTQNLLDVVKTTNNPSKVIIAGSAAEYGFVPQNELPVSEIYCGTPKSPYGMTKLWQTHLGNYYNTEKNPIVIGRIFNIIGYGIAKQQTAGTIFSQIYRMMQGDQEPYLYTGNVEIKRDFLDIVDVCSALVLLALEASSGVYNICSGSSVKYSKLLQLVSESISLDFKIVTGEINQQNTYLNDISGSNQKLQQETSWKQNISLEYSVKKILEMSMNEKV